MGIKKSNSRVTNTIFNFTSSMGGQFLTIVMHFAVRTAFIYTLGKSYLGISGLYSNILSMLSLTELGVGTAIIFKLYDPLAKNDTHRLTILMKLYKTMYRVIGIVIAALGLCFIPFLPVLISDYDRLVALNINAVLIFGLYLLKSVSSYLFFSYKSAIIKADQREYLINIISYFFTIGAGVVQIIFLYLNPNFELYVIISIVQVILQNIVVARFADKSYPFINKKVDDKVSLSEVKGIFKDCTALFIYKINSFVIKATDNMVISAFLGLEMVGLYSNYYIFYTTIYTLFSKIFDALTHSLGNLHTEKNKEKEYQVFKSTNLMTAIIGGTAAVGIFCVADELITAWIGTNWVIAQPFSLLMGLELYTLASCKQFNRFRTVMGLFQQAKYRPVFGILINLIVSIGMVNICGIYGVLIGTVVSDWLTFIWYDPLIIHKYGFGKDYPVIKYYLYFSKQTGIVILIAIIDYFICANFFVGYGWFSVIVHSMICGVTVPLILMSVNGRNPEGQYLLAIARKYMKKVTHNN